MGNAQLKNHGTPAGLQHTAELLEALGLVFKVSYAERAGDAMESPVLERHCKGIGHLKFNAVVNAFTGGFSHEGLHHAGRDVYAGYAASGTRRLCYGNGRVSGTAGHIQDLLLRAIHNLFQRFFAPQVVYAQ